MRTATIGTFFAVVLLLLAGPAYTRTWHITPGGTGDAPTIQAGVDSAAAGDTVLIADGTYTGVGNRNIRYLGKSIAVESVSGDPALCVVDCSRLARGFIFDPGDGPGAVLDGIMIRRGICLETVPPADSGGGGIWCDGASPTIRNVVVSDCYSEMCGGGMWCSGGSAPTLTGVVFTQNNVTGVGAGMYCDNSSPVLTQVTFYDNSAGAMWCEGGSPQLTEVQFIENFGNYNAGGLTLADGCEAELMNVTFYGNTSIGSTAGMYCTDSSPLLTSCLFWRNRGAWTGAIQLTGSSSPVITGCTFFENRGDDAGGLACYGEGAPVLERTIIAGSTSGAAIFPGCDGGVLSCCNIYGNAGGDWVGGIADQLGVNGNFSADPLFCAPGEGDFSLQACSPCLPGNHPDGYDCGAEIGAFGEGCGCAVSTEPTTWGAVKAMYR